MSFIIVVAADGSHQYFSGSDQMDAEARLISRMADEMIEEDRRRSRMNQRRLNRRKKQRRARCK